MAMNLFPYFFLTWCDDDSWHNDGISKLALIIVEISWIMKFILASFLGLFLSRTGAFVLRSPSSERVNTHHLAVTTSLGDFFSTVDIASLSLATPGMKEFVILLTPLSAFAGGAVVQTRRKQFAENVESTKKAMNETQALLSQSSNNFKVSLWTGVLPNYCQNFTQFFVHIGGGRYRSTLVWR